MRAEHRRGTHLVGVLALIALCATVIQPGEVAAQTSGQTPRERVEAAFAQLWAAYSAALKGEFDTVQKKLRDTVLFRSDGPRRPTSLEPENTADLASWATAAIRTESKDVAAGLTVNPFALSNSGPKGLAFSAASLEGDETRFGVGLTTTSVSDTRFGDLDLVTCSPDDALKPIIRSPIRESFIEACLTLKDPTAAFLAATPSQSDAPFAERVLWACGFADRAPAGESGPLPANLWHAAGFLSLARNKLAGDPGLAPAFRVAGLDLDRLSAFAPQAPTKCISDEQLARALRQAEWGRTKVSTTLKFVTDRFAHKGGFNPDETKPLPKGQVKSWQARVDWSFESRGRSVTVGLGYGRSRTEIGKDLGKTLSPSFSVAFPGWSLSDKPLTTTRATDCCGPVRTLNLADGETPPHVVFGLNAKGDLNLDKPDTQTTRFNKVEVTVFADFKINKTLSFRLGIPFRGEVVKRDANAEQNITERRSLQWSIPVSIVTVIKM